MTRSHASKSLLTLVLAACLIPAAALAQEAAPAGGTANQAAPGSKQAAPAQAAPAPSQTAPAPAPAAAPSQAAPAAKKEPGSLIFGLEVGGFFPFDKLGIGLSYGVEAGYVLPFLGRRMDVFAAAGYSQPQRTFSYTAADGTTYKGKLREQELTVSLGPRFRFLPMTSKLNFSLAAGPRLFFLRSHSKGSSQASGNGFAQFTEESMQAGFFATLGGEYHIGPGAISLDVDFGWAKLPHVITGKSESTANIAASVGYRFYLF